MLPSRWRLILLAILFLAPLLFLMACGSYFLWERGWSFWAWWPMTLCLALAYFLAWRWQRKKRLLGLDFNPSLHWTARDKEAWKLVEARAENNKALTADQLTGLQFYTETAQDMANELARFYFPKAKDPVGSLTVPELLSVVELASHDLNEMVSAYIPAGHLLTVNDLKRARQFVDWYQTGNNLYWAAWALWDPVSTGIRYAASKLATGTPWTKFQQDVLIWFYAAFVHRLGTYLIDLNSGRLRVGAERYRELVAEMKDSGATSPAEDGVPSTVRQVTFTVLGQVKAGKSSLINALLGERRAATNVLPETNETTRYDLRLPTFPTRLSILDTVGYGHEGPRADQLKATEAAARDSDVLLLTMHARNPARQADLDMMKALKAWFDRNPHLKLPPVLGVLTHIDLLTPAMEWQPPYHWKAPARLKEKQISEAVAAVREQLGDYLVGVVPLCVAEGKVYGVEEWLLPALSELLDEARAVALLRVLRNEADERKVQRIFEQFWNASRGAARILWEVAGKK